MDSTRTSPTLYILHHRPQSRGVTVLARTDGSRKWTGMSLSILGADMVAGIGEGASEIARMVIAREILQLA